MVFKFLSWCLRLSGILETLKTLDSFVLWGIALKKDLSTMFKTFQRS